MNVLLWGLFFLHIINNCQNSEMIMNHVVSLSCWVFVICPFQLKEKKKGSNFSKRITQSFVVETQSAALSWTKMGDCVTRMLLLLVLWHKVPVMHAEGIWLTLLCPASPLAKPLCACHVLVLQQTSKELWCALKASWGLIPSQGEACVPSWVGLAQSSLALTFTRGWEVRGFVEESK